MFTVPSVTLGYSWIQIYAFLFSLFLVNLLGFVSRQVKQRIEKYEEKGQSSAGFEAEPVATKGKSPSGIAKVVGFFRGVAQELMRFDGAELGRDPDPPPPIEQS